MGAKRRPSGVWHARTPRQLVSLPGSTSSWRLGNMIFPRVEFISDFTTGISESINTVKLSLTGQLHLASRCILHSNSENILSKSERKFNVFGGITDRAGCHIRRAPRQQRREHWFSRRARSHEKTAFGLLKTVPAWGGASAAGAAARHLRG